MSCAIGRLGESGSVAKHLDSHVETRLFDYGISWVSDKPDDVGTIASESVNWNQRL